MLFKVFDETGNQTDTVEVVSDVDAQAQYPKIPGIRFNYVVRVGEKSSKPSSKHTNSVDRLFLKAIRAQADLIITTGKTARAEQLKASSTTPLLIVTRQGLIEIPAVNEPSSTKVLVTNQQTNFGNPQARSIGFLGSTIDVFVRETNKEYPSIVLESGLTLAKQMIASELLNEVCLTVTGCRNSKQAFAQLHAFLQNIAFDGRDVRALNFEETWLFRVRILKTSE